MAAVVYILCSLTALICFILLWRGYRRTKVRLLFWSALCFLFFFFDNSILFLDLIILPDINLALFRGAVGLFGVLCLLYGLVWETR
jgi:uncharacterized protein DUF5985